MTTNRILRTTTIGVATLATAATGIALGATTAAASPRINSSLSIRTFHTAISPGQKDIVAGTLNSRRGRDGFREIDLYALTSGGSWAESAVGTTDKKGHVDFTVTPAATTKYRLAFNGSAALAKTHSGVVTVRVRTATGLTIATAATSILPGASDSVSGVLSDASGPLAGDKVVLLARKVGAKKATRDGKAVTGADGSVSFTVTPKSSVIYHLLFPGNGADATVKSAAAKVIVEQPASLSLRGRVNGAGDEVISGVLIGGGHGLKGRNVSLESSPAGADTFTVVSTTKTDKNGHVAFTESQPTASTDYELVFNGGPYFEGCTSPVLTITVTPSTAG